MENASLAVVVRYPKSGLGMYQDQQGLPIQFYKEQCKEGEEGADKRSVGRIISLSRQGCSFATP